METKTIDQALDLINAAVGVTEHGCSPMHDWSDREKVAHAMGTYAGILRTKELSPRSLDPTELATRMRAGIVQFEFKKSDGELRRAFGTLAEQFLPARPEVKEGEPVKAKKENPNNFTYFDMEKQAWRSFGIATLTKVF